METSKHGGNNFEEEQGVRREDKQASITSYKEIIQSLVVYFTVDLPDIEKVRIMVGEVWPLTPDPESCETSEEYINRVTINYLRHFCTNYDSILHNYKITPLGHLIINKKVHNLIANKFPELKESCNQRMDYLERKSSAYFNTSDLSK